MPVDGRVSEWMRNAMEGFPSRDYQKLPPLANGGKIRNNRSTLVSRVRPEDDAEQINSSLRPDVVAPHMRIPACHLRGGIFRQYLLDCTISIHSG
jgi:hypothetical protein